MIITLVGADFSDNNINDTLTTWTIFRSVGEGATYDGPTSVEKGAALSATVTIDEGYEVGTAGVTVTMGGEAVTSGISTSGNVITISIASVTGNVVIKVPTKNTATGEEEEPENPGGGEVVDPETPNTPTEPADVLQLNAFSYDEDITLNAGGDTSTKAGYNTFYEIPVLPSSAYYIYGGVRVVLLNSSKTRITDYNIYTDAGSNAGQAFYVLTDANTAFLNITVLESKCTIEDAKIQIAQLTTTIKDTKTLASTGATLVTGKKLNSSSYAETADENYIVYKDIPVTAGASYKIAGSARVWFLAEDKTTTKGSVNPTTGGVPEKFCFKVPATAAYASASIYKNNMDKSAEELELHELTVAYSV